MTLASLEICANGTAMEDQAGQTGWLSVKTFPASTAALLNCWYKASLQCAVGSQLPKQVLLAAADGP